MRRIPIHIKLASALLVPLIALIAFAGAEAARSYGDATEVDDQVGVVKAATGPNGLFNALQDERNRATIYLIGQENLVELPCSDNVDCRSVTDRALERFENQIDSEGSEIQQLYESAFERLAELQSLRDQIDGYEGERDTTEGLQEATVIFHAYSAIVDGLNRSRAQVANEISDSELRRGADLSELASRNTDVLARLVFGLIQANFRQRLGNEPGVNQTEEIASVGRQFRVYDNNFRELASQADGRYAGVGQKFVDETNATGFRELVPEILASIQLTDDGRISGGGINLNQVLQSVSLSRDQSYYGFRDGVKNIVETRAAELSDDANQRARLFTLTAFLGVVIAGLAVWLVGRSITRPLRSLTRQATDMANNRLPNAVLDILDTPLGEDVQVPSVDPVAVRTQDEVADVAEALNTVQDSALDLAVEQAVLRRNIADSFVNLGRRNQNLLGRQLDFITELEHNETNSDTLANLFRLDHLATRMRRNAESLLVLAGIDPPRKWAAPVRITDAIRAALGEVEDYQRVSVRAVEPVTVLGSAAADLAHLMAELIENALIFSPPDQTVEIRGRVQPEGYTLAVIDSGLGMPPDELARANRRLAGAESFTIAPSKYLGHYVAGNLAARHNITVTLHNSPGHGVTATIYLPPNLLTAWGTPERRPAEELAEMVPAGALGAAEPALPAPEPAPASMASGASHTASGLAKRTPRNVGSDQTTRPADAPDDDLLHALAQYTDQQRHELNTAQQQVLGPDTAPPPAPPAPTAPPLDPAARARQPHPINPFPSTPPTGYQLPPIEPGPAQAPVGSPQPSPAPVPPPPPAQPAAPPPPPPPPPAPAQPESAPAAATPSGLTRRVRGAQLPNTKTAPIRSPNSNAPQPQARPQPQPSSPPPSQDDSQPPAPAQPRGAGATPDERSAKDVYNFLSDFTAGIQRGLDEGLPADPAGPQGWDENPEQDQSETES